MGCDFSTIVSGQSVRISITIHGPVTADPGEAFSEEANLAIKHLRDLNVTVDVAMEGTQSVIVGAEGVSPQQAEALALKVRQILSKAGYSNSVQVKRDAEPRAAMTAKATPSKRTKSR
jgi:hypothetical protein